MSSGPDFNTGFTQKTWRRHWRPYVCVWRNKKLEPFHCHPFYTKAINMFEQHKTAFFFFFLNLFFVFIVCTCEHIAPLNTALCYCPQGWGAGHWRVCVCVCVCMRACERGEKTRRTQTLFSSLPCPSGQSRSQEQSHMKAISVSVECGWSRVWESKRWRERERMYAVQCNQ